MSKMQPELYLKEFSDVWELYKIQDLFHVTRGNVLASSFVSDVPNRVMAYPVYSSQTKNYGLMGYYKAYLYEDAITWTTDGAQAGTVNFRKGRFYCTNVCGVLLSDKIIACEAVAAALNRVAKKHVSYVGNPKLMNNVMREIEIYLPASGQERDKISDFLTKAEVLIRASQAKYEKLQALKKVYLDKLFPKNGSTVPEMRFKGFEGEWDSVLLKNCATFDKGAGYSKGDLQETGCPIILYGQLYTKYRTEIYDPGYYTRQRDGSVISRGGEVILPASGETAEEIARAAVVMNRGVILGGDLNIVRTNKSLNPSFCALSLSHGKPQAQLARRAQGKSVVHIHNSDIGEVFFNIPCLDEQNRIVEFFRKIDSQLDLTRRVLEKCQTLKSSFLEKMFV